MKLKIETDKLQQQAQKDKAQFEVDMQKIALEKEKIAADMMINDNMQLCSWSALRQNV